MKRFLFGLLFALTASCVEAADNYIDPTCANNGNGTGQSCAASGGGAGAFNTWASATTWTGNARYFGKGGTTWTGACTILINASGASAATPITVGSYGTGRHHINCASGSYAFAAVARSFITFDNIELSVPTGQCLYFQGAQNLRITNTKFNVCSSYGIGLDGAGAGYDYDNVYIGSNEFINPKSSAISGSVAAANTQTWTNIEIASNTFGAQVSNNGTSSPPIDFLLTGGTTNVIDGIYVHHNTFTDVFKTPANTVATFQIRIARSPLVTNPVNIAACVREDRVRGARIEYNTLRNVSGGIYVNNASPSATYGLGGINYNTFTNLQANGAISSFYNTDFPIVGNYINGVRPEYASNPTGIDGIGINRDYCDLRGVTDRNFVTGAVGSSVPNSGQGFGIFANEGIRFRGNISVGNKVGIHISDNGARSIAHRIEGNTFCGNTAQGASFQFNLGSTDIWRNNVFCHNGTYGVQKYTAAPVQDMDYNALFGNGSGGYGSFDANGVAVTPAQTAGAADVTTNPQLAGGSRFSDSASVRPQSGSPLCNAAFKAPPIAGTYYDGQRFAQSPTIGALGCRP